MFFKKKVVPPFIAKNLMLGNSCKNCIYESTFRGLFVYNLSTVTSDGSRTICTKNKLTKYGICTDWEGL